MRRLLYTFIWALVASISYAQEYPFEGASIDSTVNKHDSEINNYVPAYKLFPTKNMWTFIKLNTRNGMMWQVQFDVEGDNRMETFLNIIPLVPEDNEFNGRFTLYSTRNFYNFILLDQLEGKVWQVQWSQEYENRLIVPIE